MSRLSVGRWLAVTSMLLAACGDDGPPAGVPDGGLPDVQVDVPGPGPDVPEAEDLGPDVPPAPEDVGPDGDADPEDVPDVPDVPPPSDADVPDDDDADAPDVPDVPDVEEDVPFIDIGPAPVDTFGGGDADPDADTFSVPDVGEGPDMDDADASGGDETCVTELDCAPDPCTIATCDNGFCVYLPSAGPCDDGNPCTDGDTCDKGACQPGANVCTEVCGNGADDDLDGKIDCADEACVDEMACGLVCGGQEVVGCGHVVFDDNAKALATQLVDGACGFEGAGSEVVYRFDVPDDLLTVTAEVDSGATVEILEEGGQGVCAGPSCLEGGIGVATWAVEQSGLDHVYVVVDGAAGTEQPFTLQVTCTFPVVEYCSNEVDDDGDDLVDCDDPDCETNPICGAPIEFCDNGVDDDLDGDTDCDDSECVGTFYCIPAPGCDPLYVLGCGSSLTDGLGVPGSTDFVDAWACGVSGTDGPETTHSITAPGDAQIVVTVDGAPPGTSIVIVEDAETCEPSHCIAAGEGSVAFQAQGGLSYAIAVDAPEGTVGTYDLSIGCVGLELCSGGVDDDGDGATDCEDSDCYGEGGCVGQLCTVDAFVSCGEVASGSLAGDGILEMSTCGPTGDGPDVVAAFTPDAAGQAVLTVSGSSDPQLLLLDGQGPCDTGYCLTGPGPQDGLTVGPEDTFYVVVEGAQSGTWTLTANCVGYEVICDDGVDGDGDGAADCGDADCAGAAGCDAACPVLGELACGQTVLADPTVDALADAVDSYGCAGTAGLTGAEAGWSLALEPGAGTTTVRATLVAPEGSDATLVAVASGAACDPTSCFGAAPDALEFDVSPSEAPYVVVDGIAGDELFGVALNCGPTENSCDDEIDGDGDGLQDCADPDCSAVAEGCDFPETDCGNGVDDDADQLTDCDDPDCAGLGDCPLGPGVCVPVDDLDCGLFFEGATDAVDAQPGQMVFTCPGGDVTAADGTIAWAWYGNGDTVSFSLFEASPGARLVVLESDDGIDCNPAKCIASTDQLAIVPTTIDQPYLAVLAGAGPGPASGTVGVVCGVGEVHCDNGIDDNEDGLTDCVDPTCQDHVYCQYCYGTDEVSCGGSASFSPLVGAGGSYIVDGTCGTPSPGPERVYSVVPDVNGLVTVDVEGPGAVVHAFTSGGEACAAEACVGGGTPPVTFYGSKGTLYLVAIDTTTNGDASVSFDVTCTAADEICDDGVDNDGDAQTDCEDAWCGGADACPGTEDCDSGVDDDGDGATDCDDPDCLLFVGCPLAEDCTDGIDNNGDGATDCEDAVCAPHPACD